MVSKTAWTPPVKDGENSVAIGIGKCLDGEEAISTDATLALADAFDLLLIEGQGVITIVNQDKIVTRTVHFGEFEHRSQ